MMLATSYSWLSKLRGFRGQGKWFRYGRIEEGIFKSNNLIEGRAWLLNDDCSYDYYQVTNGVDELIGKVPVLPGFQND